MGFVGVASGPDTLWGSYWGFFEMASCASLGNLTGSTSGTVAVALLITLASACSEEKLAEKQRRRDLIVKWRHVLADVVSYQGRHPPEAPPIDFVYQLNQRSDFFSLEPRLDKARWDKYALNVTNSRSPRVLDIIRDEIARLEREWKL